MKKKSSVRKDESGFGKLARLITTTNEKTVERLMVVIKSESDDIRSEMDKRFTKVDQQFDEIKGELRSIRSEIADINRRLDRLEENVAAMKGYSKEIDELRLRVKHLEKQLNTAR